MKTFLNFWFGFQALGNARRQDSALWYAYPNGSQFARFSTPALQIAAQSN
jgi:hypothetical protein